MNKRRADFLRHASLCAFACAILSHALGLPSSRAAEGRPPLVSPHLPDILAGRVHVLPAGSGTTLLLLEDHRAPLIFAELQFPGGSDSPFIKRHPEAAFTAFLRRAAAPDFKRRADELAISIVPTGNARTANLSASFIKEDLDSALHLLRELLHDHGGAPPAKKTGWQWNPEALQAVAPPSQILNEKAQALFCPRPPEAKPSRPPPAPVTTREDPFRNRDRQLRLPGRVIGLAGDLSVEEALKLVAQLGLPEPAADPDAAPEQPQSSRAPIVQEQACRKPESASYTFPRPQITQVYFSYGRVAPAGRDADLPRLYIADQIFNRRLHDDFSQTGDTYTISAAMSIRSLSGFYRISSFSVSERAARFEAKLQDYVRRFGETGITAQELSDARATLRGLRLFGLRSPQSILRALLGDLNQGVPVGERYRGFGRFDQLTLEEINEFIRRFYRPADFVMVKLVPAPA